MSDKRKQIIDHISRLEGQLASVKAEVAKTEPDCAKASQTLVSAARSFAGLREQFVESFLLTHIVEEAAVRDRSLLNKLLTLIKA